MERDRNAILRDGGNVAQPGILLLALGAQARLVAIGGLHLGLGPQMHVARRSVDDDRIVGLDQDRDVRNEADGRDAERARDDRHMARGAPLLQDQPPQPRAVVVEKRRRPHGARHDDRVLGHAEPVGGVALSGQLVKEPVGEIVEIVQPLAQIRIGLALNARAGVVLHALHGGFRGQAGHHRLAQPAQPAAIVGDHPNGLENLAMLAGAHPVAMRDELVDRMTHRLDRQIETAQLGGDVLRQQVLNDDAQLVQHDISEPHALADRARRASSGDC